MRKVVFFLVIVSFVMLSRAAYADEFNVDGFTIWANASKSGKTVSVSGRVRGVGCKKLRLNIFLHDEKTNRASVIAIVNNADVGSNIFSGSDTVYQAGSNWEISSIYTQCISN